MLMKQVVEVYYLVYEMVPLFKILSTALQSLEKALMVEKVEEKRMTNSKEDRFVTLV